MSVCIFLCTARALNYKKSDGVTSGTIVSSVVTVYTVTTVMSVIIVTSVTALKTVTTVYMLIVLIYCFTPVADICKPVCSVRPFLITPKSTMFT